MKNSFGVHCCCVHLTMSLDYVTDNINKDMKYRTDNLCFPYWSASVYSENETKDNQFSSTLSVLLLICGMLKYNIILLKNNSPSSLQ